MKNYATSEQNCANIQGSRKILNLDNSSKNTTFKKLFLISNSLLNQLLNDTTHNSLQRTYQSAKIDLTRNHLSM